MIALLAALLTIITAPYLPASYACNGSTTAYSVPFPYLTQTDLLATSTTATGVVTTLALTTDYSLSVVSTSSTATLTLTAGSKCPSGSTLKIARVVALTQPTSFKSQTNFLPQTHETAYDRLEMQIQQLNAVPFSASELVQPGSGSRAPFVNVKAAPYYAVGDGVADDTAAIQAAIAATAGGTLIIPTGTYLVCVGLPLLITKSITIRGQNGNPAPGAQNAQIMACTGLGATTDVILVQPTGSNVISTRFYDMAITAQSGTPGRYAIRLDGTNGQINQVIVENLFFSQLGGGFAIRGEGTGLGAGTPAIASISRSYFAGGGLSIGMGGDLIKVRDSTFTGASYAVDAQAFTAGSSMLMLDHNYILSDKGIHVGTTTGAIAMEVIENQFQPNGSFTGSNGAFLDLDGSSGSHIVDAIIARNSCQMNGFAFDCMRINYADRTQIYGNIFRRGNGGAHDVAVTANATETDIGSNDWVTGLPYTSMVSDAGTRTRFLSMVPGANYLVAPNNKPAIGAFDEAGTPRPLLSLSAAGEVQIAGYHTPNSTFISSNGVTWIYDNAGNLGLAVGSAARSDPTAASVASVANLYLKPFTFATLPTPTNFMVVGCSDCDPPANPPVACTSAGAKTGAVASRINGAWICHY